MGRRVEAPHYIEPRRRIGSLGLLILRSTSTHLPLPTAGFDCTSTVKAAGCQWRQPVMHGLQVIDIYRLGTERGLTYVTDTLQTKRRSGFILMFFPGSYG